MKEESPKVLVTGGAGYLGRWAVAELLEHGYLVTIADRHRSEQARTYLADLCDLGQVYGVMAGHEAVLHLAAIPSPGGHPPEVVFRTNVLSTFNVLEAACTLGIKKVVLAGSVSALGFAFRHRPFDPLYLPFDERHPLLAQDAYGLSKSVLEELGRGYARRDPDLSITSLRFAWVIAPNDFEKHLPTIQANPKRFSNDFWTYVDARDAAVACRLALEHTRPGFDAYFIAAPDTLVHQPTLELIRHTYPTLAQMAANLEGRASVLDCRLAENELGFRPGYSWINGNVVRST